MDGTLEKTEAAPNAIGKVVSVSGARVVVLLEPNVSDPDASRQWELQVGTLMKIERPSTSVYGVVTGLTAPFPSRGEADDQMEILELSLVGECVRREDGGLDQFQRGVSSMPTLNDIVNLAEKQSLEWVYASPSASSVQIGAIQQDRRVGAHLLVDELLAKHFAIMGTTGAGKSCAATLILHAILNANANAHVVLLDPHGEYAAAFGERANVLGPASFQLPYWLFELDELLEVLFGPEISVSSSEASILSELIPIAKRSLQSDEIGIGQIAVNTPLPYRLSDLSRLLDDAMGRLEQSESLKPYRHLQAKLTALQNDVRFNFMFEGPTKSAAARC